MIADGSASSSAFFPAKIDLQEGDTLVLFNAKAEVVNEHIEIQLDYNGGRMEQSRKQVDRVNEDFNLSTKSWVPVE